MEYARNINELWTSDKNSFLYDLFRFLTLYKIAITDM